MWRLMDRAEWMRRWEAGDMGSWWFTSYPVAVHWLTELRDCRQCPKKFEQPWLVPTGKPWPNNFVVNAEIAWHWQDTHGIPLDILLMNIAERIGFAGPDAA